jgi:inosine-uridine nucleoside N-ribohydrolase
MARKIIIDTDPGVDDSMAIFYALNSPEFDVVGLTTVFGNAPLADCTQNALRLLEIANRPDIPVAAGADRAMAKPPKNYTGLVHGMDGQGNLNLPPPVTQAVDEHAAQFLIDTIQSFPGEITIVALGPLTNLGLMFLLQPDIGPLIREIVLMGGNAVVPGNVNPAAEANIWNDPDAADLVFGAGCSLTMIGLDVTLKIRMGLEHFDQIAKMDNDQARHITRILPVYRTFYQGRLGREEIPIHDSTTITYMLDPSLFKTVKCAMRVETEGISRGKTWPGIGRVENPNEAPWMDRPMVNICVDVNGEQAVRMEIERLSHPPVS